MKVLLGGVGTRGDIQPMLALALALRERGHEVTFAGPPENEGWATGLGLTFAGLGERFDLWMAKITDPSGMPRAGMAREVPKLQRSHFGPLEELVRAADVVVMFAGFCVAGISLAEKYGKRYHAVAFCPQLIPSAEHPALVVNSHTLPRWLNRLTWWLSAKFDGLMTLPVVNEERHRLGLPPLRESWAMLLSTRLLVASEPSLAALPADVPARYGATQPGAFILPEAEPIPADVEEFLAAGPPPVYVGFGSMVDGRPEQTTELVVAAARLAGARVLLSGGLYGLGRSELPPTVKRIGPAPHGKLFPRCAAVVHHGGAGTTASAARAGVPQVIVPHMIDQFYWGHHVQRLGLSPMPIHRRRLNAARLAAAMRACLTDEPMRSRAMAFSRGVILDGAQRAALLIEGGGQSAAPLRAVA